MFFMPIAPVAAIITHKIMLMTRKTHTKHGFVPVWCVVISSSSPYDSWCVTVAVQAPASAASPPSPPAAAGFIIVLCGATLRCICAASTRLTHP